MQKPVRSVIATARALIGVMSQSKLPDETMRMLLHQIISDYDNVRQNKKELDDRFLHESPCGVVYDEDEKDFVVYFAEGGDDEVREFNPEFLYYSHRNNPRTRHRIYLSTIGEFAVDSAEKYGVQKVGAFYGNNYDQYRLGMRLKLNISPEIVTELNWRVVFRKSFDSVLGYDDPIPFPAGFTSLLETSLAFRALDVVDDVSQDWDKRYQRLKAGLASTLAMQEQQYASYLQSAPNARTRRLIGYDYKREFNHRHNGRYVEPFGRE